MLKIDGAGEVSVLLALKNTGQRILAEDSSYSENITGGGDDIEKSIDEAQTVLVLNGESSDETITLKYVFPEYSGAVIVAEGADSNRVKLDITEAVKAATGLSADRIKVIRMK